MQINKTAVTNYTQNMSQTPVKTTPMMIQWHACKEQAGEALVFFHLGDFYEAFYQDAEIISQALGLTLTKRQEIPMCGVPCHAAENYIDKLVGKGYKVAIADQVEDPRQAKGIVKREVTRIVTPGTLINSSLLVEKANNFFACIAQVGQFFGLAYIDLSCALFRVQEIEKQEDLLNTLFSLQPKEVLVSVDFEKKNDILLREIRNGLGASVCVTDSWRFSHEVTATFLISHFRVVTLDGFGLRGQPASINASGALLAYLQEELNLSIDPIRQIETDSLQSIMGIDRATRKNLELTASLQDGSRKNTLLSIIDHTQTPMGGRLLTNWLTKPLVELQKIIARQEQVGRLAQNSPALSIIRGQLEQVRDMERLLMRLNSNAPSPRDMTALAASFSPIPYLQEDLLQIPDFESLANELQPLPTLLTLVKNTLIDEPPARVSDGNLFRRGVHDELDELYTLKQDSRSWLASYQEKLKEELGIKTLKVGYNRMVGYYIEISKGQTDKAPGYFEAKQTLTNGQRYVTAELKSYEQKVLTAQERIKSIEAEIFLGLKHKILEFGEKILKTAAAIAKIDALQSLGFAARLHNFTKPKVHEGSALEILSGRHPIVEAVNYGERFIPNDTHMDGENVHMMIITGPNMAGKSTYIRQVALLAILAQIGSFVPASSAKLPIFDKIYSRIGASDDLSRGQSTFMVEMTETANILHNATAKSLVILDEIGRGTSTYDGISIAWAVAEHLLTEKMRPKTLFATHYWELTQLEERTAGAANYHVAVDESSEEIRFLRKIVRGSTDKSYGIHVAKLAGMPQQVIERAGEILQHLETSSNRKNPFDPPTRRTKVKKNSSSSQVQLTLFE